MNTDQHRLGQKTVIDLNDVTFKVNGCAMRVLNDLGHGFHEKIYENALAIEFAAEGLLFEQQKSFEVSYRGQSVGSFVPDFVVANQIIVELKTIDVITDQEKGQVLNYLRASGLKLGLILNFKRAKLELQRVIL